MNYNDSKNWKHAQVGLEEAQELNEYLNKNKTKWTQVELLERIKFCQTWNSSKCVSEVAARTNTSSTMVLRLSELYQDEGFKLKKFDPNAKYSRATYTPTPRQIARAVKKIQAKWSPAEENSKRRFDWRTQPVKFEEVQSGLNRKLPSSKGNE